MGLCTGMICPSSEAEVGKASEHFKGGLSSAKIIGLYFKRLIEWMFDTMI